MSRTMIELIRYWIVAAYTLLGFVLSGGGMQEGDFVVMVVLGAICLVAVFVMDWINAAPRREP